MGWLEDLGIRKQKESLDVGKKFPRQTIALSDDIQSDDYQSEYTKKYRFGSDYRDADQRWNNRLKRVDNTVRDKSLSTMDRVRLIRQADAAYNNELARLDERKKMKEW